MNYEDLLDSWLYGYGHTYTASRYSEYFRANEERARGYTKPASFRFDEDLETGWYVPPEDDSDLPDAIHYAGVILSGSVTVSDVDIAMVDKYEMDAFSRHFDAIPNLYIDMLLDRKLWHIYSGIPVVTTMEKN